MQTKLVIVDRDGVINSDEAYYTTQPEDFHFIAGSIEAIVAFHQAGYQIAVATNQAGIDRGFLSHADLASIHAKMLKLVRQAGGDIDRILYADKYDDHHPWRKPNPGMPLEIMAEYGVYNKGNIPFIGDSITDIQAALKAGCQPVLVRTGKGTDTEANLPPELTEKVMIFDDLLACSQALITTQTGVIE